MGKKWLYLALLLAALCTVRAHAVEVLVEGAPLPGAQVRDGSTYVPLRGLLETLGDWELSWDGETASAASPLMTLAFPVGSPRLLVNGYPVDCAPAFLEGGRTYVPLRTAAQLCGASVTWTSWQEPVEVALPDPEEDQDLYWLSRIISAESRGESLLGQLAVGAVVLNRVESGEFPDSIYDVVFEYNGERRIARGELPTLAEIRVNGELAGLSTPLQAGDEIYFLPAVDGADAAPVVSELADRWETFQVELFGQAVEAGTQATVNGVLSEGSRRVHQMDRLEIRQVETVGELLESMGFPGWEEDVTLNGIPCTGPDQPLRPGDRIELEQGSPREVELLPKPQAPVPEGPPPQDSPRPLLPDIQVTINGKGVVLPGREDGGQYQFFDLFNYVDIDPSRPQGRIILRRNGAEAASYLETIQDRDQVEIYWSEDMEDMTVN